MERISGRPRRRPDRSWRPDPAAPDVGRRSLAGRMGTAAERPTGIAARSTIWARRGLNPAGPPRKLGTHLTPAPRSDQTLLKQGTCSQAAAPHQHDRGRGALPGAPASHGTDPAPIRGVPRSEGTSRCARLRVAGPRPRRLSSPLAAPSWVESGPAPRQRRARPCAAEAGGCIGPAASIDHPESHPAHGLVTSSSAGDPGGPRPKSRRAARLAEQMRMPK